MTMVLPATFLPHHQPSRCTKVTAVTGAGTRTLDGFRTSCPAGITPVRAVAGRLQPRGSDSPPCPDPHGGVFGA